MSERVADILQAKGSRIISVEPSATVFEAIATMDHHKVGAVVVLEDGKVRGVFTERDYLRRIALEGRRSASTQVDEVMTRKVLCIEPSFSIQECMAIMTLKRCRHLPVMSGAQLLGIVSIGDCVKQISENAQARVRQLTDYVTGQYPA